KILANDAPPSQNMTYQLNQLLHARTSLECFIDLLNTAGDRGITKQSAALMQVTLESNEKLIGLANV
ncbi:hypothetical protein ACLBVW_37490, partial [Pseudomonas aeruginosa]|uniref:hypothetical protein n=1 Tax=Pseudomonas aeruginosa TaxID=287 RepID=UPI003969DA8D